MGKPFGPGGSFALIALGESTALLFPLLKAAKASSKDTKNPRVVTRWNKLSELGRVGKTVDIVVVRSEKCS